MNAAFVETLEKVMMGASLNWVNTQLGVLTQDWVEYSRLSTANGKWCNKETITTLSPELQAAILKKTRIGSEINLVVTQRWTRNVTVRLTGLSEAYCIKRGEIWQLQIHISWSIWHSCHYHLSGSQVLKGCSKLWEDS